MYSLITIDFDNFKFDILSIFCLKFIFFFIFLLDFHLNKIPSVFFDLHLMILIFIKFSRFWLIWFIQIDFC